MRGTATRQQRTNLSNYRIEVYARPDARWIGDGGHSSQACACEQASEHARAQEAMGPHGPRPVVQRPLGSCIGDGSELMCVTTHLQDEATHQLTKLGRQSKGEAQVHLGPSLCMLWGLGPHGPKLPQFSPSSGPLGPRACFCSQSVHGGQWLLRGHFRLSARPSPAEGGRPDSSLKFGFRGFSPILAEREIPHRGRGRRPLWHHRSSWGPPTAPTKGT